MPRQPSLPTVSASPGETTDAKPPPPRRKQLNPAPKPTSPNAGHPARPKSPSPRQEPQHLALDKPRSFIHAARCSWQRRGEGADFLQPSRRSTRDLLWLLQAGSACNRWIRAGGCKQNTSGAASRWDTATTHEPTSTAIRGPRRRELGRRVHDRRAARTRMAALSRPRRLAVGRDRRVVGHGTR